ncbi:hypothetical protein HDU85_003831 [Gaertneriomyces sp. JEL0708]|nr:hypothetical protein HDU85_003831 [Gaertneriomyces sp. JEL0708]
MATGAAPEALGHTLCIGVIGLTRGTEEKLFHRFNIRAHPPIAAQKDYFGNFFLAQTEADNQLYHLKLVSVGDPTSVQLAGESGEWPDALANADGILLCYDICDRVSFLGMLDLLVSDNDKPLGMLGWYGSAGERQVDRELGAKLSGVFNASFTELSEDEAAAQREMIGVMDTLITKIVNSKASRATPVDARRDSLKAQLRKLHRSSTLNRRAAAPSQNADSFYQNINATFVYPMPNIRASSRLDGDSPVSPLLSPISPSSSESGHEPDSLHLPSSSVEPTSSVARRVSAVPSIATSISSGSNTLCLPDTAYTDRGHSTYRSSGIPEDGRDTLNAEWKRASLPVSEAGSAVSSNQRSGFTLEELIERLTSPTTHDMEFIKIFVMLYRKFLRPSELLDRLMDRFDTYDTHNEEDQAKGRPIHPVQLRVCNVLIHWCQNYWCDFHTEKMRFTLHVFLEICAPRPAFAAICQKLGTLICREPPPEGGYEGLDWGLPEIASEEAEFRRRSDDPRTEFGHRVVSSNTSVLSADSGSRRGTYGALDLSEASRRRASLNSNAPTISSFGSSDVTAVRALSNGSSMDATGGSQTLSGSGTFSFLDLDNEAIAQQLNVLESEIFRKIQPRDLLQHIWSRQYKGRHAASVAASISHFNFISSWVATRVLSQKKLKARAKVLGKFMKIAQVLRNNNNYNSLMAVLAGINSAAVLRLRQTFKLLRSRQSYRNYLALEKLMSSERSFHYYRQSLKRSELPCIPYLGVFLRDLLYIDENKDKRADGTINLPKFLLMGDVILMIQSFQSRPYPVARDPYIASLILSQPVMTDEQAYQRSLELEPRHTSASPSRAR